MVSLRNLRLLSSQHIDELSRIVYVAYSQSRNQIIVGHEGTDPSQILSVENDLHFSPTPLLTVLNAAGTPEGVEVHNGFQVREFVARSFLPS